MLVILVFAADSFAASNEIVYNLGADPKTIDPALNYTSDGNNVVVNIFEGLLRTGLDDKPEPGCAESWEVSDDATTFTFKIRKGNFFIHHKSLDLMEAG